MRTFRIAALPVALALLAPAAALLAEEFRFEKLNRTYTDFAPPIDEIDEGGVTVKMVSPKQALVLRDHKVRLTPGADGVFGGQIDLELQGKGTLIADVAFGPLAERFTEEVIVPPQTISLAGRAKLRRVDGGYEVIPVELPKEIQVAIQSPTMNRILALCDQAAILSLGSIECSGLDRALTRPSVPLPAGETFTLADSDLTDADRAALDALLAPAVSPQ